MKLKSRILLLDKLALLIFLAGLFIIFFTWYGIFVELIAILLMIYISRYKRITWWRIFSYSVLWTSVFVFLLFKYHEEKIKIIEPDWNLMPSAEKYYIDPLYTQRSENFNFDSLMLDKDKLKNLELSTTDTQGVPPEAPLK